MQFVLGPHSVKTASIGTLGRTRTPMPVIVPSAPDVSESSRLHEDALSVSTFVPIMHCITFSLYIMTLTT